jgi:hypothetical protein
MKRDFEKNGYAVVQQAISEELRDFVTQYAIFDEAQDFSKESDVALAPQVPGAHSKYADPAMETMLLHLKPVMEKHTGLQLYPTYSYYRVYRNSNELVPHRDRPACEISATVCFNVNADFVWSIYIEGAPIDLNPGDMLIYRGHEKLHWREPLEHIDSVWQVQGFFHYVDVNGPYAEWKFDKRATIGQSRLQQNRDKLKSSKPYITFK